MPWTSETRQGTAVPDATPTPRRYRAKLDTVRAVNSETARVYREARSGILPVDQAYKLASILSTLAKGIESADIDTIADRLDRIEGVMALPAGHRRALAASEGTGALHNASSARKPC